MADHLEIVNIVGSGKLNVELDLAATAEDLRKQCGIKSVEHSRRRGNRLLIHFEQSGALGILAPTGVHVITGAGEYDEVERVNEVLFEALSSLGIISDAPPATSEVVDEFEIKNIVSVGEIDTEPNLNLNTLVIELGLEHTEYEPEQFSGLVYRPAELSCTILVFASGKVVLTGIQDADIAHQALDNLRERIENFT